MNPPESRAIRLHEDPELFREALGFTAAETGFPPRLIEKDYFCSVLLQYLAATVDTLVFKGGTCLAKIHSGFYRLSEDLDFTIPVAVRTGRAERGRHARGLKEAFSEIETRLPGIRLAAPLKGANDSSQYLSAVRYNSLLGRQNEMIKVEVGLREPLLMPPVRGPAQTLLRDPVSGQSMVAPFEVPAISLGEAVAEKLRAAISRREVAIRDFYDIDHAVRRLGLDLREPGLIEMVRAKLAVPFNDPLDVSDDRLANLRLQIDGQLKPVLRTEDLAAFDLDRAFAMVRAVANALGPTGRE